MDKYRFAQLSEDQKRQIKQLEQNIGDILIAYEEQGNEDGSRQSADYYQNIFCE